MSDSMSRINIIGASGSGKTTLARSLSELLGIPYIDVDGLYWGPNWTPPESDEVFAEKLKSALAGSAWTLDANYSRFRHITWGLADTVVFLDYSFPRVFAQLFNRTLRRIISQEVIFSKNTESFRTQFFTKDSLLLFLIQTFRRRRQKNLMWMAKPEYSHIKFFHFHHPRQTAEWVKSLTSKAN